GLVVYPTKNQAADQVAKDEGECHAWARQNTGVDPANPMAGVQVQQGAPPPGGGASAGRGAVRGAAAAGLIGNIADEDASDFAAAGAVIGGVRGARAQKAQAAQAQQQSQAQTQAIAQERMGLFTKAYGACMEARSYTVK
ncbi:MAG TPA: hypothetical protein VNA66_10560, partial [Gammaproteobacteria bacterium]|nr:hypothetical protein [Gammaproteobacteria bacterium]